MSVVEDLLIALYPWTKAGHLASLFAWMAGLFYLPRLYVYHVEKAAENRELAIIYEEMERKLLRLIMNPAMISSWTFGLALVLTPGLVDWSAGWVWVKAAMILLMTLFHHALARWRKELAEDRNVRSGRFYRLANEAPTVLMLIIVAMVVVKPF